MATREQLRKLVALPLSMSEAYERSMQWLTTVIGPMETRERETEPVTSKSLCDGHMTKAEADRWNAVYHESDKAPVLEPDEPTESHKPADSWRTRPPLC